MRILVTGAAGALGSAIAAHLRGGHEVTGIDIVPGHAVDFLADIRDPDAMAARVEGMEAIVHAAALHAPHVGLVDDDSFRRTNVAATGRLLDLSLAYGVGRFILTSSTSVYGHALVPDRRAAWIDEQVAPEPRDIYDSTKLEAEALVRSASAAGLRTAILRVARCFAEPWRDMALHRLHRGIDRRDVARAHALALAAADQSAETYIISATPVFTRDDRVALIGDAAALVRQRLPGVAAEFDRRLWTLPTMIDRIYSSAKAEAMLGFRSGYGVQAVLDGDCDPSPLDAAR